MHRKCRPTFIALLGLMALTTTAGVPAQELLWESRPGFRDFGQISVVNGVVVSGGISGQGHLLGMDAGSGRILWRTKEQMVSGPDSDGRHVYAVSRVDQTLHRLVALEVKTGKVLWSVQGRKLAGSPRVHVSGGRVFLVGGEGMARAYDAATGKLLWTFAYSPGEGYCTSSIVSADGMVFFAGGESQYARSQGVNLWALDAATGEEVWRFALKPETYSRVGVCINTPAVGNGVVAVTGANMILGLDARSGRVLWQHRINHEVDGRERQRPLAPPHIVDDRVYAIFEEGLGGWDLHTGAPVLSFAGHFPAEQSTRNLESADGRLYFTANLEQPDSPNNRQGFLYAFDIASGRVLWKHRVNRPSKYSSLDNWSTAHFTLDGDAIYYENHKFLAKLRR